MTRFRIIVVAVGAVVAATAVAFADGWSAQDPADVVTDPAAAVGVNLSCSSPCPLSKLFEARR